MKLGDHLVLVCTCRGTMPIEAGTLARACGAEADGRLAVELCRAEIGRFEDAAAQGGKLLVACTQEAPEFRRAGEGAAARLGFVNIREAAGWSLEADRAAPKIAALIQGAAALEPRDVPEIALRSEGVTLVYGSDDRAVEAASQLKDRLDLTVVITGSAPLTPPGRDEFPVVRGTISRVTGHMGAWELVVDGFAEPLPSSRRVLEFGPARDGARSRCDLILDLSGGQPLLTGHARRDGYLRASPDDPVAVQKALLAAADLVGEFGKPRYVTLDAAKCAHARNGQIGCTRCLDACPMSAIGPAEDSVAIDPYACAGCGACAAVCPTTAVRYAEPGAEAVARWLRTVLTAYRAAGGEQPVLLFHDEAGAEMIELLARHGDGLPARVIPLQMAGQFGLDAFATALAFGAAELLVLSPRNHERREATAREIGLIGPILEALGYGAGRVRLLDADDPFQLGDAVWRLQPRPGPAPAAYLPTGDKIALTNQALAALHAAAPSPIDAVPLPRGAPIGRVLVDTTGCTLCLSCVAVCPTSALRDNPERPQLSFVEDLCVQCGLCATTCPEHVVSLEPRATFGPGRREPVLLKEEEPALCISCGKPFGTKSSIERIAAQLAGKHWMFRDPAMTDRIRMCADCRVIAHARTRIDPYAGPPRPPTRTTDDYR